MKFYYEKKQRLKEIYETYKDQEHIEELLKDIDEEDINTIWEHEEEDFIKQIEEKDTEINELHKEIKKLTDELNKLKDNKELECDDQIKESKEMMTKLYDEINDLRVTSAKLQTEKDQLILDYNTLENDFVYVVNELSNFRDVQEYSENDKYKVLRFKKIYADLLALCDKK